MSMQRLCVVQVLLIAVGPGAAVARSSRTLPTAMPPVLQHWRTFTTRDGLPHDSIRAICVEGDRLWVGTDEGLAVLEHGQWRTWKQPAMRENNSLAPISAIDIDPETGDAWLGTWGGGVLRLTGGRFDGFDQINSGLAGDLVFDLVFAKGKVCVATNGGLSCFDPITEQWELYLERRAGPGQTAVTSLGLDPAGEVLNVGAWCGRLWRVDLREQTLKPEAGPPDGLAVAGSANSQRLRRVATALSWGGGVLWWTTQDRVFRRRADGVWDAWMIEAGLRPTDFVRCITARGAEEVWLGTDRGLCVLMDGEPRTWVSYRLCEASHRMVTNVYRDGQLADSRLSTSGLPHDRIRCIAMADDGAWIGTPRGLVRGSVCAPEAAANVRHGRIGSDSTGETQVPQTSSPAPATLGDQGARDRGSPTARQSVSIGILTPVNRTMPLPGGAQFRSPARVDLTAVQLAVADANRQGGYRGEMRFEMKRDLYGYARYAWYLPEDELITLSEVSGVSGLVASIGPGRRIVTACVTRTETPVVNAAATRATVDEAASPWIARCPKDGQADVGELASYLFAELGVRRPAVLRTRKDAACPLADAFIRLAREQGHPAVLDMVVGSTGDDLSGVLDSLRDARADTVLSFCETEAAAWIVRALRRAGLHMPFVGGENIVRHDFGSLAGGEPGKVIALWGCPSLLDADGRASMAARYQRKFKKSVKVRSFRDYEAASHLLYAINLAGLDRGAIRETLASMRDAHIARLERGRWQFGRPRP